MRALVVVVLLLAVVTPASGACAWVLWGSTVFPGTGDPTRFAPILARESRAESEERRAHYWAKFGETVDKGMRQTFQCYPDTVDPRGPKGK